MASKKINSIHDLLEQYNDRIINQRDKGTSFERLMKSYLELDPLYQDQFKAVYLWTEWPHKTTGQDYGIDLVAESHDGEFTAIQCKFYAASYQVQKKDIDSFFNESGKTFSVGGKKKSFGRRIIISTSDNWSEPAEKSLHGQTIPVTRIHVRELEQSPIDWSKFSLDKPEKLSLKEKKKLRPHQKEAIDKVIAGFKNHDRGKLIMACGTGKTFTALKLAERVAKNDGVVLFLVPSISLLSQTLREWTAESESPFHAFAVCSDSKVGKHSEDISKHDLSIPASTDTSSLIKGLERVKKDQRMTVIFSTYQSIDVVSQAQKKGLPEFDVIICDEAHRTTGVTLANKEESHFVKVHEQKFIKGKKRLYMTATPRIFGDAAKTKADEAGAELCSMDDVALYGPEFHRLGFGKAVSEHLLTDYKVLVLAIDESIIDPKFQKRFADENQEIQLEDIAKIIGCWNGLSKRFVGEEAAVEDKIPMKRAVAFARAIKDSKQIASVFQNVVQEYIKKNPLLENILNCELAHVDGTFNVLDRNAKLDWLKEDAPDNTCRILTNARCLSEGVDVPALDAVLFLNPRDSMVDVVQSVGRIMRKAEGKKYGYVILPIGIPAGVPPDEALKDNKKYKVVWQVLQALRAHDDRFDAEINKIELNKNRSSMIQVIGVGSGEGEDREGKQSKQPHQLAFNLPEIEEWKDAIYAKIVLKCGSRPYWENWAADVAKIAERHAKQIQTILKSDDPKPKKAFDKFLNGIRKNLNPSISETDAIEMLSQQLITKPVFDALFEHYKFTEMNPVSQSMQSVLKVFEAGTVKEDAATLKSFYDSVRMRVRGINNAEARQRVIKELYDRFFNVAFKKMSERLGIVYTPIEVVDFIIQSVEDLMQTEFRKSLSDEGVHILDPFTGTGTFIVRLLQSGILKPKDLRRKFESEIHANEIVLLAYYIASVNIEETYHDITAGTYKTFDGAVLTDTFQLTESPAQGSFAPALPENHERIEQQKRQKISVIIGNPPYSVGQGDANSNNQNLDYPALDEKIRDSYVKASTAALKNSLYDSYIRSVKWASERVGDEGVIGFVINGSFIDSDAADGMRKCLAEEFSKIYFFNLRGNQRTSGEISRQEGGKIFGSGSRTQVAIVLLIKSGRHIGLADVYYHDIGDYLSREEKLKIISEFKSFKNIPWINITPNNAGDWINQRSPEFEGFHMMSQKGDNSRSIFSLYSSGVKTNRDAWAYSFSQAGLNANMRKMIATYNSERERYTALCRGNDKRRWPQPERVITSDHRSISWSGDLVEALVRGEVGEYTNQAIRDCQYRPFSKMNLYYDPLFNNRRGQIPKLFPTPRHQNVLICVGGVVERKGFSVLATSEVPDVHLLDTGQCFPLYLYEKPKKGENLDLLLSDLKPDSDGYVKYDAITNFALQEFRTTYGDQMITKEDIFYYVYGLLHSSTYRNRYQHDLKKMLPRIPMVQNFWAYSSKGRELANLHISYESVEPFELDEEIKEGSPKKVKELYRVNEAGMKFPKVKKQEDRTTIILNQFVTLKGIPESAYDYVVNGKPAIEWIMERYAVTTDKDSGIRNDPNEWSDDPRYIVDLVKRIVRVSLETNRLVSELPKFELLEDKRS
ncbi:MAG TPA: DEAD/DEAH box helicase family protein [Pseudobdellovibrionaceae bacterium]|nr:DEAD/DEAH box helicase family protein [Pseudobdellovibrionaceae bacterium]